LRGPVGVGEAAALTDRLAAWEAALDAADAADAVDRGATDVPDEQAPSASAQSNAMKAASAPRRRTVDTKRP